MNTIKINTPDYEVISNDISNLVQDETFTSNITDQIEEFLILEENLRRQGEELRRIAQGFENITFNISAENPYADFSELRARVDSLFNELEEYEAVASNQKEGCEGVFSSIECFFEDIAGTLIVIGVVALVVVVGYFLITQFLCK